MRKLFVAFMMAVTVAITTAFPVYAAPMTNAEAIAALHQAVGRVYKNGDTANITVDLAVTNWNQTITEILNKAFPACGQPEIGPVYYEYDDGSSVRDFTISGRIPPQKRYSRPARTVIRSYRQHIFTSQGTIRMRMASLPRR